MKCPRCPDAKLDALATAQGVTTDFCGVCGGVWLDRGELAQLLGPEGAEPGPPDGAAGALPCPSCDGRLVELEHPPGSGLQIDLCPSCRGIWLDRGEVGKLKQLAREGGRFAAVKAGVRGAASDADGPKLIPLVEIARQRDKRIHWSWVLGGVLVIGACLGVVALLGEMLWIADTISDAEASPPWMVGGMAGLAFALGGFLVGWKSPGFTIWEPALAAVPCVALFGALFSGVFTDDLLIGFAAGGFLLAMIGGVVGERFAH